MSARTWWREAWTSHLRDDPDNGKQKSNDAPVRRPVAANYPAKGDDGDGLDVSDYGAAHGAGFVDDVELGYVDHACAESALDRVWSAFNKG